MAAALRGGRPTLIPELTDEVQRGFGLSEEHWRRAAELGMRSSLVAPLIGGSDAAIVVSTLAIAALFTPLRRRIQALIDRRFYRRKYDAARVLAAFGATARDETDLDALAGELLRVVDEAIQPEFVGLWLREVQSTERIDL